MENTYYQFLTFDLGDQRMIKKIATLGRSHTNEFVTEYIIQYSDDGELWRSYVARGGEVQVKKINRIAQLIFLIGFFSVFFLLISFIVSQIESIII